MVAEGIYAGAHRSRKRGPGVEFGGHRPYVPGDDLRWLDRRALLRHDRLIIREFETETDRGLRLIVDASASMAFKSQKAPAAKFAFAALIAGALARLATASGDPVGLEWLGGEGAHPLPARAGREAFERVIGALESVRATGDLGDDDGAIERAFGSVARKARRGTIIVLLSDLLDLPERTMDRFAALASGGRLLVALQVLDPEETTFPFEGTIRLRALEGDTVVETDADVTRERYLERLADVRRVWSRKLTDHGGHFLAAQTTDDAAAVLRNTVSAIGGRFQPNEGSPKRVLPDEGSG